MPKIRSIHPDACESEKLLQLSDGAERTLWRLGTHSDDEGRGVDNPKLIAAKVYPLDDGKDAATIDDHMAELARAGMVVRYTVGGKQYYEIHDFTDWQKPRHFTPSKLPAPSDGDARMADARETHVGHTSDGRIHGVGGVVGGGVGGGGGEGEDDDAPCDPAAESFDDFWQRYPRHHQSGKPGGGGSRKKALDRWRKMKFSERELALAAVDNYRAWCERSDGEFAAHATTWLNEARWEQWQEPAPTANGRPPPGREHEALDRYDPAVWTAR